MQSDLWQRRIGWLGLLTVILGAGGLAQVRHAAADDADPKPLATAEAPSDPTPTTPSVVPPASVVPDPSAAAAEARKRAQEAQAQAMQQMQVQQAQIQQHVQAAQAENQLRMQQAQQMNQLQPDEIRALVNKRLYAIAGEIEKYWLGVECKEASPDLRAQLGLEDGQGLVVARVAPDSPAEKAGLKQYDVILAVGETKLSRVLDLSKAVSATEGKTAELRILRGGKEQLIAVTPAQKTNDGAVQIFAHPNVGMVMPGNMQMQFHLPDNLEVKIDRKGNEPAKITVRRGNTEWETTADDLSKLPDDVRPFVQQMLGGFPGRVTIQGSSGQPLETNAITLPGMTIRAFPGTPAQPPMAAPMAPAVPGPPAAPMGNSSGVRIVTPGFAGAPVQNSPELMRRLEQVSQQLEKTQQELKRLRETIPQGAAPSDSNSRGEKE